MSRSIISHRLRRAAALVMSVFCLVAAGSAAPGQRENDKPEIQVRVTPPVGIAPLRIVATAELVKGADDYADFYCPRLQWDWSDETKSEIADNCEPYEPGKSQIRRRFAQQHTYREPGVYYVVFQMFQGRKLVGAARIKVDVRGD
jgi:hypothetical protein